MTSGLRLARAVYSAAVRPAGPEPTMTTFSVTAPFRRVSKDSNAGTRPSLPAAAVRGSEVLLGEEERETVARANDPELGARGGGGGRQVEEEEGPAAAEARDDITVGAQVRASLDLRRAADQFCGWLRGRSGEGHLGAERRHILHRLGLGDGAPGPCLVRGN